ncbi:hypothetical protein N7448_004137 [Penicillium atrosanguineum]|uniref:Uncharacterized protein n=1 Tax=Penicillium atrosanguineum TaxID=1132637 RepID=A0A9W9L7V4_9EURO|nr:Esterase SGNH hydrolase-type subgroup [Penicillium atrosanguineum]KAJ5117194.1 hypothetical protein N7526_011303 [Penicillium atrosanguineum]KAJ5140729.1 hypothetical protein N7448_004137 [Penicillium atrosanguineum]KAJ5310641.1 Esterase SGNH hydrolase-type subgroup [Penicillium atrosanguineum]KAJ5316164.1 hypothetical protein N7476_006471 [Penicillium atrosanguineum]
MTRKDRRTAEGRQQAQRFDLGTWKGLAPRIMSETQQLMLLTLQLIMWRCVFSESFDSSCGAASCQNPSDDKDGLAKAHAADDVDRTREVPESFPLVGRNVSPD